MKNYANLSPAAIFKNLTTGLELKEYRSLYPHSIFYLKNGEIWFEQDETNKILYCSWKFVWSIFEDRFRIPYFDVQKMIKRQIKEHLDISGYTPEFDYFKLPDELHWKDVVFEK